MRNPNPARLGLSLTLALLGACSDEDPSEQPDSGTEVEDSGTVGAADSGEGSPDAGELVPDAGFLPDVGGMPSGSAPTARSDVAYAFDPSSERLFMFFGDRAVPARCSFPPSDFVPESWFFSTQVEQWGELGVQSAESPQVRARGTAVWDETGGRMILFGGRYRVGTTGNYTLFADVWAFEPNSAAWTKLADPGVGRPTARVNSTLEIDGSRVLLHGGNTAPSGMTLNCQNDTWAFDLGTNTWTQIGLQGPRPPIRCFHTMALDRTRGQLYVFAGGGNGAFQGPFYDSLWVLDLASDTWSEVAKSSPWPDPRINGRLVFDGARDRLVLFGGHDNGFVDNGHDMGVRNDLWTFDLGTRSWTQRRVGDSWGRQITDTCNPPANFTVAEAGVPSPERRQSHLFFVHGDHAYLYGGKTDCGITNDTWILDLETYEWREISSSFRGVTCPRSGQADCNDPSATFCG